jgi:hypothetical protein
MKRVCGVLLALVLSPAAVAECLDPVIGVGGSGISSAVSNADRRELEQLLGTPLDALACARMQPVRRLLGGFRMYRGFFVLTADEALFVGDKKVKEVLFRTTFLSVRNSARTVFGTQRLSVTTGAGESRFELACDLVARRVLDEFVRRTPVRTHVPVLGTDPKFSCD